MATRGIKQLQKLRLVYCEHGGSSRTMRDYISSQRLIKFAQDNPTVEVIVQPRNGHHPYIKGEYLTGFDKQVGVKNENMKFVCKTIDYLNNSSGRKIKKLGSPVRTDTPSVQGIWTPMLDLQKGGESFKIELMES